MFKFLALFATIFSHNGIFGATQITGMTEDNLGESIYFKLYRRGNQNGIDLGNGDNISAVDTTKLVKFIVHGWLESSDKPWYSDLTKALLKKYDCNVIQVDWSLLARQEYSVSAQNTKIVGDKIGELVQRIHRDGTPLSKFHVIGHSLGGQVAGFSGKKVKQLTGSKILKITGLDAAGPLFETPQKPKSKRLSDDDAEIVENLHTDGGVLGYKARIGTIDYFANGGSRIQPGCKGVETLKIPDLEQALDVPTCSHAKSHEYYIRALNGEKITMTKCGTIGAYRNERCRSNKKINLGTDVAKNEKGSFYFKTSH